MQSFVFLKAKERITGFIKTAKIMVLPSAWMKSSLTTVCRTKKLPSLQTLRPVALYPHELKETNIIHFSDRKPNKIWLGNWRCLGIGVSAIGSTCPYAGTGVGIQQRSTCPYNGEVNRSGYQEFVYIWVNSLKEGRIYDMYLPKPSFSHL